MESATTPRTPFESILSASWPAPDWAGVGVVVGVSGGADSVALVRGLSRIRDDFDGCGELAVAHFSHGLRPIDAADADWVATLCERLDLPLETGRGDVRRVASEQGDGIEAAARSERLAFLLATAQRRGGRYVATAHTEDDQVETVLFRILRGTGISGLAGIRRVRSLGEGVTLIRPMLGISRAEVQEYLDAIGQDWREDATNADEQFTRNRIRHRLLPLLREEFNPRADEALLRLAHQAEEACDFLAAHAALRARECVQFETASSTPVASEQPGCLDDVVNVRLDAAQLADDCDVLVAEVFRIAWRQAGWPEQAMTEAHWKWLVELVHDRAAPPKRSLPGEIEAGRVGQRVVLTLC